MPAQKLDSTDIKLVLELQKDCKQSIKELSQKLNLSITPVRERIKKLETNGVIDKYVAVINPLMLGKNLTVYCSVTLIKHQESYFKKFEDFVSKLEEVEEIIYVTGPHDYLLKVMFNSMLDFEDFIVRKISRLDIISNLQSSFVIHQLKK